MLPRRENGTRLEGILTSCVSHPCILTGELLLPLAQDEGHAARSTFLTASSSSSFSSSSFPLSPPLLFSSSFLLLYYLPKAAYVRCKSFILNLTSPFSQSCRCWRTDEEARRWREYGRTGGRRICGNRARNSVRKHDDCITSNVPFQRAIRHAYKILLTLYSVVLFRSRRSFPQSVTEFSRIIVDYR